MLTVIDTSRHRREGGFTVIELLVVMVILGVLFFIAMSTFGGSKTTVKRQEAIVAAHSLQTAVEAFRRDREGRVPSTSADWPVAAAGPIDADATRRYMRARFPETVSLSVLTKATPTGPGTAFIRAAEGSTPLSVEYAAIVPNGTVYRITVRDGTEVVCAISNEPITGAGADTC